MTSSRFRLVTCIAIIAATGTNAAELPRSFGDAQPKRGGSVVYAIEGDITTLDPHIAFGGPNKRVAMSIFEGLVKRDRANIDTASRPFTRPALVPALATAWEILDGGTRYRFHLRRGVVFHDGTPFNAKAVAFNIRRVTDPEFEYFYERAESLRKSPLRYVTAVHVIDDSIVDILLARPWTPFLSQLGTFLSPGLPLMISPQSIRRYGNGGVNTHPVGTGPFALDSIQTGVNVVTKRNPAYWNQPLPFLDQIIYVVVPEQSTRMFALESGEVDIVTQLSPDSVERLRERFTIVQSPLSNQIWYMAINMNETPLNDPRVRRAINLAIDRRVITGDLLRNMCIPSDGIALPTSPLWDADERYPYNPARARQLLAEAGYPHGFKTAMRVPISGSSMLIPVPMAEWIQIDLARIGIDLQILTHDWVTYLGYWVNGLQAGIGFNVMSWASDYDEFWAADLFGSGGFGNTGHINDAVIDAAWVEYQAALTDPEQLAIAQKIFERVDEQAYVIPICSEKITYVMSRRVKGVLAITDPSALPEYWWVEP